LSVRIAQLNSHGQVVAVDAVHQPNEDGDRHDDDPRPGQELRGENDAKNHERRRGSQTIDEGVPPPAGLFRASCSPTLDHARLGEREAREDTDDVEIDDPAEFGLIDGNENGSERSESDDAVGKREPVAAVHELPREVPVAGEEVRKTGEVRIACVRGQEKDEEGRDLNGEEQRPVAEDGESNERDHRARGILAGTIDVVQARENREPDE
jgi:hypothetical protein